jgi:1-phosphofructokinase family hexose kinase
VDALAFGGIARVQAVQEDAGGKGINVSRVLRSFGYPTIALGFLGGATGRLLGRALAGLAVESDFTEVPGESRTNLTLTDGTHEIKVNAPGPRVPPEAADALLAHVRRRARASAAVVLSGSLPPGVPESFYADLIRVIREEGARPVLDTDGPALARGVAAGPYLIKPNRREAESLLGIFPDTDHAHREAVRRLSENAIATVCISLGAEGAVLACNGAVWRAEVDPVPILSTVGSGDALLACLLMALLSGTAPDTALAFGTAAGLASATLPGSRLCAPADVERMQRHVHVRAL